MARELYDVLDRKALIDWSRLMDRPDGMDAMASSDSAVAGQPRRSVLIASIDLDGRPVSIRVDRMKTETGDPYWLFSPNSLENVPALFDRYGPSQFEQALPAALRNEAFWGLRWWEVAGLPVLVLAGLLVGWLTYRAMTIGQRNMNRLGLPTLLRAARPAAVVFAVTSLLGFASRNVFVFSGPIDVVMTPLLITGYVVALLWLIINVVDVILDSLVSFEGDDLTEVGEGQEYHREIATTLAAVRRLLIVVIALIGFGAVLSQANILRTLGFSLLASAGALTLVAAYAARNVLANIMASVQIALNKSARLGDKVMFKGYLCSVERINFTFVQLRVWTGERLVVPVGEFVETVFENWTMKDPFIIRTVTLRLAHEADVGAIRQIYEEVMADQEGDLGGEENMGVLVTGHDVFGKEVLFKVPCCDPNTSWSIACEVREKLLARLRELQEGSDAKVFPDASPAEAV